MGLIITGPTAAGSLTLVTATSGTKTPSATNNYHSLTTNSLALTAGTWELWGSAMFSNSGAPGYTDQSVAWYGANGADSSSVPSALSTVVTVNSAYNTSGPYLGGTLGSTRMLADKVIVTVTSSATVYLVTWSQQATSANARITVYANARKIF